MPTYQYACTACQHQFEAVQSFSDDPLTQCPQCDGRLRKLFGSVGVVFKGPGFYRTDSRNGSNGGKGGDSKSNGSGGDSTSSKRGEAGKESAASKDGGSKDSGSKGGGSKDGGGKDGGGKAKAATASPAS